VTNQQLKALWQRITTLGTPTGTTITPTPTEKGDQAAGATVVGNVTASEPTYGSGLTQGQRGFPSLGGYDPNFQPETRFYIQPGDTWGLRMLNDADGLRRRSRNARIAKSASPARALTTSCSGRSSGRPCRTPLTGK
jgi:hypothetical protein